jgi:hypothetical protein
VNRCYFCKSELWDRLVPLAQERGLAVVVDGTNADDTRDHRPGAAAARERAVASPLAEVGLTKAQIRWLSQRRGIPTWSQPSSPCLSSRVPYGTAVTPARLARVERAEAALRALGVAGDLRVRFHDDLARIEIAAASLQEWLVPARAAAMVDAVRPAGFARVAIDLRGFRSGSLNVLGGVTSDRSDAQSDEHSAERYIGGAVPGTGGDDSPSAGATPRAAEASDWTARARQLQLRLGQDGYAVRVEARAALALVVVSLQGWPTEPTRRRTIVRAALDVGFSHVAVEFDGDDAMRSPEGGHASQSAAGDATLPGVLPA